MYKRRSHLYGITAAVVMVLVAAVSSSAIASDASGMLSDSKIILEQVRTQDSLRLAEPSIEKALKEGLENKADEFYIVLNQQKSFERMYNSQVSGNTNIESGAVNLNANFKGGQTVPPLSVSVNS